MDTILSILEELFKETSWGYNITCLILVIACYGALVDIIAYIARKIVIKTPNQSNANFFMFSLNLPCMKIRNHSDVWNDYRQAFHRINNSSKIKTNLKIKIKKKLAKKKLYLNNVKINDNYNTGKYNLQ